jgi:Peptidase MA superfamily
MRGRFKNQSASQRRICSCEIVRAVVATLALLDSCASSLAQTKDWPFRAQSPAGSLPSNTPASSLLANSTPPPFGATMRQKSWDQLPNRDISYVGSQALAMNPRGWYHGETENFIIHYRNFSDALQIAREIEFDLWYIAKTLGATKEQYARKSHVYVFQDDNEWRIFVREAHQQTWSHSFAVHDDLFLNVHGTGQGFESHTLAHETTHAVVARIYRNRYWPVWLSEGFADYMADACGAVRRGLPPGANPRNLREATMNVKELIAVSKYPEDFASVTQLYDSATKLVRYLLGKYPAELFPKFVGCLLDGTSAEAALAEVYGNEFRDLPAFDKRFQTSIR